MTIEEALFRADEGTLGPNSCKILAAEVRRLREELQEATEKINLVRLDRDTAHKWCSEKLHARYNDCNAWFESNMPDAAMPVASWHIVKRLWVEVFKPIKDERDRYRKALERIVSGYDFTAPENMLNIARDAIRGGEVGNDG